METLSISIIKKGLSLTMEMQSYAFSLSIKDTLQQVQRTKLLIFIRLKDKKSQPYADILHQYAVFL